MAGLGENFTRTNEHVLTICMHDIRPDKSRPGARFTITITIMPKLRSIYDGRLIDKTAYNEWKAFHR